MFTSLIFLLSAVFGGIAVACTGTIKSLADVPAAVKCTVINIGSFAVPPATTFKLNLLPGTIVNLNGDISFGTKDWAGPMFSISGTRITFNGNGHKFDGAGTFYWDGKGASGAVAKPLMMQIRMSGTFKNVKVLNSPAHAFALINTAALLVDSVTIDNSLGDKPNSKSGGQPAGCNTDGFDISTNFVTIQNSVVMNQDDCLAINQGSHITFKNNKCIGGHGISVGSIDSSATVSAVTISGNIITNSDQAFRIKTKASARGSTVSGITYSGNRASGIRSFGVIIDQSYPSTLGNPGTGVKISGVNFVSPVNTITLNKGAKSVAVNCGRGACTGTWNWSNLKTSGGVPGPIKNSGTIIGYHQ